MRTKSTFILVFILLVFICFFSGCSDSSNRNNVNSNRIVMTSDTILSGIIISLLPQGRYSVEAILPPGQCPGHYDVKISDIEKLKKADLIVSFVGMPFMNKTVSSDRVQLLVDAGGRNWMSPDSYIYGLDVLAEKLSGYFPEDTNAIMSRKNEAIAKIKEGTGLIRQRIKKAGVSGIPVITSSMQKETLEWMGLRVAAEYGRQEAMSAREIVRLVKIGKYERAKMVVDNLQSGPDTGKGIAEALMVKHVVLTNFPSERGYLAALEENVETIMKAATQK